jgi:hypothetical protein
VPERILKSTFVNPDARVRCPTADCWGDLVLFPTGEVDTDGIPAFADGTLCPLCMRSFEIEPDISDRDLYLKVAWIRANPGQTPPDHIEPPEPSAP